MSTELFESPERVNPEAERAALIALSLVAGVGPGRMRAIMRHLGSAAAALRANERRLAAIPGVGPQTAAAIARFRTDGVVEDQLERASRAGARMVQAGEASYPRLLAEIYDPPPFFWMRGEITEADAQPVAVVGTRRPSEYGKRTAWELSRALVERGVTIVSGLAYGIDAVAHRAALDAGGRTIAVLGSGVDNVYPGRHVELARAITRSGAVISEFPMGALPDAPNFPRRNRIVSGLALGVVVIEAYDGGGALITTAMALEQNREVFAVPGNIHSKSSEGANRLIQRGLAKLVLDVDDVMEELGLLLGQAPAGPEGPAEAPSDLHPFELKLFEALGPDPIHIDTLCVTTGMDSSTALVYLLELEFRGLIRQMAGKQFLRA
jgi:DNA processing protein